jgi:membrane protease YdiL (CAAX protease family)
VNALLAPHRRIIWVAWLIAALLFLAVGNGLVYSVTIDRWSARPPSAGPGAVIYTVWMRRRPLADLGLTTKNWREAVGLGLVLAAIQYFLTLYGYRLPAPIDWVPLLTMSLMVGPFEAIFFRAFIQTRLIASFGPIPGVVGAAALYALYYVGYGMGAREMMFLFALGLVTASRTHV